MIIITENGYKNESLRSMNRNKKLETVVKPTEWYLLDGMIADYYNGECDEEDVAAVLDNEDMIADMLGYIDFEAMVADRG